MSFIIPFLLLYIFISSCLPAFALVDDYSARDQRSMLLFFTQLHSGHVAQMCFSLFGAVKINAVYVTHSTTVFVTQAWKH